MRPAFLEGDLILYERGGLEKLRYGDVVILQSWLEKDKHYVKRIKGVPGDIISVDASGYIERNGDAVRETEVLHGYQESDSDFHYPYRLGENEYFCMGDNRPVSLDSRTFGPAPTSQMMGKVIAVLRLGSALTFE